METDKGDLVRIPVAELETELRSSVLKLENEPNTTSAKDIRLSQQIFSKENLFKNLQNGDDQFVEYVINNVIFCLEFVKQYLVKPNGNSADVATSTSVNLKPIQITLERLFVRYWNTRRDFDSVADTAPATSDIGKFFTLIYGLVDFNTKCGESEIWVTKRVTEKFIIGLNKHSSDQICKLCFLVGFRESSAATILLQPIDMYLSKTWHWEKSIIDNIVFKVLTKSELFWTNWAYYVLQSRTRCIAIVDNFFQNYKQICSATQIGTQRFAERTLVPATMCLIALSKEYLKATVVVSRLELEHFNIFQETMMLLENSSREIRCCGAIAGIILRELLNATVVTSKSDSSSNEELPQLEFGSVSQEPLYKYFHSFFTSGDCKSNQIQSNANPGGTQHQNCDELSAAESKQLSNEDVKISHRGNSSQIFKGIDATFISKVKFWNLSTYNEVLEVLLEPPKELSEYEASVIKRKALLRIPILISSSYSLDPKLASKIARTITDQEFDNDYRLPFILALYKLTKEYSKEVCTMLGDIAFDSKHYALGQRFLFLEYYLQIIQLLSGRKCLLCTCNSIAPQNVVDWKELDDVFWKYFVREIYSFRRCFECRRKGLDPDTVYYLKDSDIYDRKLIKDNSSDDPSSPSLISTDRKTRRFASPRVKIEDTIIDSFSNQFASDLWSPIYSNLSKFFETNTMNISGIVINYLKLGFRLLVEIIQGTTSLSPFITSIGSQVTDLILIFLHFDNGDLRLAALQFLAVYLHHTKGNAVALQNLNSRVDLFQHLDNFMSMEGSLEVKHLIQKILLFTTVANTEEVFVNVLNQFKASMNCDVGNMKY